MLKTLLSLAFGLLFFAAPAAFAQHGHGNGGSRGGHYGHFDGDGGHHVSADSARHFDGRHFDAAYRYRYFGRGHAFFVRPVFYGGGYRFWYGGFWFSFYDAWPGDWCYCDGVYVDYDPVLDCYYLVNPVHPGFRLRIGVVF